MVNLLRRFSLYFAWMVAVVSTLLSLYGSEMMGLEVCNLCWYQRICMYPLAIILGVATYRDDDRVGPYVFPLALMGLFFAIYQYLEQMIPGFAPLDLCGAGPSCDEVTFMLFGFVTYPFLSILAFLLIVIALLIHKKV